MKVEDLRNSRETCTACAGTMLLEFAALSRLSGEPIFEAKAHACMDALWKFRNRGSDLMGTVLNVHSGDWVRRDSGVGAGIDSYYEYCLKSYVLLGDSKYLSRFNRHYNAIMKYISQGPLLMDVHMHRWAILYKILFLKQIHVFFITQTTCKVEELHGRTVGILAGFTSSIWRFKACRSNAWNALPSYADAHFHSGSVYIWFSNSLGTTPFTSRVYRINVLPIQSHWWSLLSSSKLINPDIIVLKLILYRSFITGGKESVTSASKTCTRWVWFRSR